MVRGLHPRDIRSTFMIAFAQDVTEFGIRFVDAMLVIIFIFSFGIGLASLSFSVFQSSLYARKLHCYSPARPYAITLATLLRL